MRLLAIIACMILSFLGKPAHAEKRVALVIGNGAYKYASQWPNPKNDADDVSAALRRLGFNTVTGIDLDKSAMDDVTVRFGLAVRDAEIAVFYYSGHVMQFANISYLIPIDVKLTEEADLRHMTPIDDIINDLQHAKTLAIMVLDSCRDNPIADDLKRSIGSVQAVSIEAGLSRIDIPLGMIVASATEAGCMATNVRRRSTPYTAAFLRHIEASEEIRTVFRKISLDAYEKTNYSYLPELSLSFVEEFFLRGRIVSLMPDEVLWRQIVDSNDRVIVEQFIKEHPTSPHRDEAEAKLTALKPPLNVGAKPSFDGNIEVLDLRL